MSKPAKPFLITLFSESFQILTQNLTLLWPFLGLAGIMLLLGENFSNISLVKLDPISLGLLVVCFAVIMAFMAGLYHMSYHAAQRVIKPSPEKKDQPTSPLESLTLLKEFFPGVGAYFPHFFFGGLVYIGFFFLLIFGASALIDSWGGIPAKLEHDILQLQNAQSVAQMQQFFKSLPANDYALLNKIGYLGMGGLGILAIFHVLTMFWPTYVIAENMSGPKAFLRSVQQFFKDPFGIISIVVIYTAIQFILMLPLSGGNPFVDGLQRLFALMANVWLTIVMSYYVISKQPKETPAQNGVNKTHLTLDA